MGGNMGGGNMGPNNGGGNFGNNSGGGDDKNTTQVTIPKDVSDFYCLVFDLAGFKCLNNLVGWSYYWKSRWTNPTHSNGIECFHYNR